jgi:hypothetical protein
MISAVNSILSGLNTASVSATNAATRIASGGSDNSDFVTDVVDLSESANQFKVGAYALEQQNKIQKQLLDIIA